MKIFFTALTVLFSGWINFCIAGTPIQKIEVSSLHKPIGAFSHAISVDLENTKNIIFVSGQFPYDNKTGKMIEGDIRAATKQTLDNIQAILEEAGSSWKYVVKVEVLLQNMDDWTGMNEEFAKRFPDKIFPARQTAGVQLIDALLEMSCIAIIPKRA